MTKQFPLFPWSSWSWDFLTKEIRACQTDGPIRFSHSTTRASAGNSIQSRTHSMIRGPAIAEVLGHRRDRLVDQADVVRSSRRIRPRIFDGGRRRRLHSPSNVTGTFCGILPLSRPRWAGSHGQYQVRSTQAVDQLGWSRAMGCQIQTGFRCEMEHLCWCVIPALGSQSGKRAASTPNAPRVPRHRHRDRCSPHRQTPGARSASNRWKRGPRNAPTAPMTHNTSNASDLVCVRSAAPIHPDPVRRNTLPSTARKSVHHL